MSLFTDIKKRTQIPCTDDETAVFIPQQDYNASKRNQRMRKQKLPRNVNLYEMDDDDNYDEGCDDLSHKQCFFHPLPENEIASSIREATGGIDYSNEKLEEQWRIRQIEASLNSCNSNLDKSTSSVNNCYGYSNPNIQLGTDLSLSEIKTDERNQTESEESILRKCKLNRNAAIRGLLQKHMISTSDLEVPINSSDVRYESNIDIEKTDILPLSNLNGEHCTKLIPCEEDPDIFMQPIQVYGGIDESKYKDIDFSVPHLGKKTIVTPRQYYLNADDSDFDFVKKDKKK